MENFHDIFTCVCKFCSKTTKRVLYRVKHHLSGGYRNETTCKKCPNHINEEIRENICLGERNWMFKEVGDVGLTFDEEDDDLEVNCLRKRWSSSRSHNKDC